MAVLRSVLMYLKDLHMQVLAYFGKRLWSCAGNCSGTSVIQRLNLQSWARVLTNQLQQSYVLLYLHAAIFTIVDDYYS
jgi:hypothetical protein